MLPKVFVVAVFLVCEVAFCRGANQNEGLFERSRAAIGAVGRAADRAISGVGDAISNSTAAKAIGSATVLVKNGSWSADIQEELRAWKEEQNKGQKFDVRSRLNLGREDIESFFLNEGVPQGFLKFVSANAAEVANNIFLHLYTRSVKDRVLTGPVHTLPEQGFSPIAETTVLIHGYAHDTTGKAVQPIKDRILATANKPVNVIGVDWSALCPEPFYVWSRSNVKPTGDYLGRWLAAVVNAGLLRPSDIHIVGHSLGAHIAGTAGATVGNLTGEPIKRVTGLDPAFPLFVKANPQTGKISTSDAKLVDVVHTADGRLGLSAALGHVDFYANGGRVPQPGCGQDRRASCSHERVCLLYAESVGNPTSFPGRFCPVSVDDISEETCTGPVGHMGHNMAVSQQGKYYFKTEATEPFDPSSHITSGNTTTTHEEETEIDRDP